MTFLYHNDGISLPVGFELIAETEKYTDRKSGMTKRRSPVTRNELYRSMLQQAVCNQIQFQYVLNDAWFASAENMNFVTATLRKDFVMPLRSNRKVALSLNAGKNGHYQRAETLATEPMQPVTVYSESVPCALLLIRRVFTNEDGSTGMVYLVTSDTAVSGGDGLAAICQKRWNAEPYHN